MPGSSPGMTSLRLVTELDYLSASMAPVTDCFSPS
ncbi:MAG: hypothetical protein K0S00_798 [Xanthobacteraceae bacterium]|jgi:hypothetical protein|nr:hypothetical protein [Xanthobacteraceae bacterium]